MQSESLREVVLIAVESSSFALRYAAPRLRGEADFLREAVQRNPFAIFFAGSGTLDSGTAWGAIAALPFSALQLCSAPARAPPHAGASAVT